MGYNITRNYINYGSSRPGSSGYTRRFLVAHDTGNPGSTAYGNRNYFNKNQPTSGAHTFIDDSHILEIVPLYEKVYHVRYNVPNDDNKFGADANDSAIGVELCWGGNIDFNKAYNRYVWYFAYLCDKYGLNPRKHIVAHSQLDPGRRSDPGNALERYGKSFSQFIEDVANEVGRKDDGLIQKGDQGSFVRKFQNQLTKAGYDLPQFGADGHYGNETINAVKKLQGDYGFKTDGIVGKNTRKALDKAKKGELTVSQYQELTDKIEKLERELKSKADSEDVLDVPSNKDEAGKSHEDNWQWLKDNNITTGVRPHAYLTREQYATMAHRFYENVINQPQDDQPYSTHADTWQWLIDQGITQGGTPHEFLTREQFATLLKRYDETIKAQLKQRIIEEVENAESDQGTQDQHTEDNPQDKQQKTPKKEKKRKKKEKKAESK